MMKTTAPKASIVGIPDHYTARLLGVLQHEGLERIVLFGSRAKGTHHPGSDIDLALFGTFDRAAMLEFQSRVVDLDMLWKVDLLAPHLANFPEIQQHIDRVGITLWQADDHTSLS